MGGNESNIQHNSSSVSSSNQGYFNKSNQRQDLHKINKDENIIYKDNFYDSKNNKYSGEIRNGNKHGKGQMHYTDGSQYDGDWKDNMRHGEGVFINERGEKYTGQWKKNNMHGAGILENPDQTEFKGNWKNGQKHGTGTLITTGNKKWKQTFTEGRMIERKKIKDIWEMSEGDPADISSDIKDPCKRKNRSSKNSSTHRSKEDYHSKDSKSNKNKFGPETMSLENFRCNLPAKLDFCCLDSEAGNKKVVDWSKDDVYSFQSKQDLKFAAKICYENEISGKNLLKMTDSDWSTFGLSKGKQITLRDAIEKLRMLSKREVREKLHKRFGRNSQMNYDRKFMNNDSKVNSEKEKTPKEVLQARKFNKDKNVKSGYTNKNPTALGSSVLRKTETDDTYLKVPKHSRNNHRGNNDTKQRHINMIRSEEPVFQNRYFTNYADTISEKSDEYDLDDDDDIPKTKSDDHENASKRFNHSNESASKKNNGNDRSLKRHLSSVNVTKLLNNNTNSVLKRARTVSSDFTRDNNKLKRQQSTNFNFDELRNELERNNDYKPPNLKRNSDLFTKQSRELIAFKKFEISEAGGLQTPDKYQGDDENFNFPPIGLGEYFPTIKRNDSKEEIFIKNMENYNRNMESYNINVLLKKRSSENSDDLNHLSKMKLTEKDQLSPGRKTSKLNFSKNEIFDQRIMDIIASPQINRKKLSMDFKKEDQDFSDIIPDCISEEYDHVSQFDACTNKAKICSRSSSASSQDISELEKKVMQQSRLYINEKSSVSCNSESEISEVSGSLIIQIKIQAIDLDIKELQGESNLGKTYHGTYLSLDVSIKEIPFLRSNSRNEKNRMYKKAIMYSEIRHPNIVLFMGISERKNEKGQDTICVITEYMNNNSQYHHIHEKNLRFSEKNLINMLEDISLGMTYLHGNDELHYSLKSNNIQIDENNGIMNFKINDFGLRDIVRHTDVKKLQSKNAKDAGKNVDNDIKEYWLSREALKDRNYCYQNHDDIYSFGILLYEIISGEIPFKNMNWHEFMNELENDEDTLKSLDGKASPKLLNLMRKCLNKNPKVRPEFKHLLQEIQNIKKELNNNKHIVKELFNFFGPVVSSKNNKIILDNKRF